MEASKSAKQLKEHLKQQQEPFSLHNYLSERRFFLNNFSSHHIIHDYHHRHLPSSSSSSSSSSEKTLKWWITYEKHKLRKRFLHASSILSSLLYRLLVPFGSDDNDDDYQNHHHKLSAANWVAIDDDHHAASEDDHYTIEDGEAYSPKLVDTFHSFTLPELRRLPVDAVAKPNWISTVEKQWEQPLANSVCGFKSDEGPARTAIYTSSQKSEAEPFFSTYLPRLLINPNNILKFRRPKRDKKLHRSKRTHKGLFGRVEKAREFKENKVKRRGKNWLLERQYCREAQKITKPLKAETCVVSEEWTNLQRPIRDIHFEIGDAIMDDILKEMLSILVNN